MEEQTLRTRPAGEGCKPPPGASVKSRGAERDGKGGTRSRQVWARKASESEPPMTCRKLVGDVKTGGAIHLREEPGGNLPTAQAASGMKVARAWSGRWCGTWEPVAPIAGNRSLGLVQPPGCREGGRQGAETPRRRVPMRGTGSACPLRCSVAALCARVSARGRRRAFALAGERAVVLVPGRSVITLHVTKVVSVSGTGSSRRVREHRARLREQGLRPVQIWVPDDRAPGFAEEAHRQSRAVAASEQAQDDQAFIESVSIWPNE